MRKLIVFFAVLLSACVTPPAPPPTPPTPVVVAPKPPPKIALVLGGGAARGFAHIGVIKALEAQGIKPDIIVGTSAGSVVRALYASGMNGFQLQELAMKMEAEMLEDWTLPNRGVLKGEALQNFINDHLLQRPIQVLPKPLGIVATDLASGERTVFRRGNPGMAVRASSAVPGVFQPVSIGGREYVDGGLTAPVPAEVARDMGADFVIAVDISKAKRETPPSGTLDVLLQTFAVMGHTISQYELQSADVVIHPQTSALNTTDFESRHKAVLEGEKAAAKVMTELKAKLAKAQGK